MLKGQSVLEKVTKELPLDKIGSPKIQSIVSDLHDTLKTAAKGVGLAAPQIGESVRIFVVSPAVFRDETYSDIPPQTTFINPKITWSSKDHKKMEEGCLSIPGMIGKVRRPTRVTVDAYNKEGEFFTITGVGFLAQIFQHEIDHLDGILFDTKATDLRKVE